MRAMSSILLLACILGSALASYYHQATTTAASDYHLQRPTIASILTRPTVFSGYRPERPTVASRINDHSGRTTESTDDVINQVADVVHKATKGKSNYEIEIKIKYPSKKKNENGGED